MHPSARKRAPKLRTIRHRFAWGGAAAALAFAGASCAGILSIDDRTPDPQLDDAGNPIRTPRTDGAIADDHTLPAQGDDDAMTGTDTGVSPSMDAGDGAPIVVVGADGGPTHHCATGVCRLASALNHPFLLATDANNVYWTEFGDGLGSSNGYVRGCSLDGCLQPTDYAIGLTNPRGIAVDATNVYFGTATYGGVTGGIYACAIGGCGSAPTLLSAAGIPYGVAVDGTYVYWVDEDEGSVHKVAKVGAHADIVLVDGAATPAIEPGVLVVDGPFLYFNDTSANAYSLPVGGGKPTFLGTSTYSAHYGLTTDSTSVYFGGSGQILRATKSVADSGKPITTTVTDPTGLAFDPLSNKVYWADWGSGNAGASDGTIGKISSDGGGRVPIAASLAAPEAVSVTGNDLAWISNGTLDSMGNAMAKTGAVFVTGK